MKISSIITGITNPQNGLRMAQEQANPGAEALPATHRRNGSGVAQRGHGVGVEVAQERPLYFDDARQRYQFLQLWGRFVDAIRRNNPINELLNLNSITPERLLDLLFWRGDRRNTLLHLAIQANRDDVVELFLQRINGYRSREQITAGHIANLLTQRNDEGNTLLHLAVQVGRGEATINLLLHYIGEWGVRDVGVQVDRLFIEINNEGNTLLHVAVQAGRDAFIGLFLQLRDQWSGVGFDVAWMDTLLMQRNNEGNTLIHIAVLEGRDTIVGLLGSCMRQTLNLDNDQGHTPLELAVIHHRGNLLNIFPLHIEPDRRVDVLLRVIQLDGQVAAGQRDLAMERDRAIQFLLERMTEMQVNDLLMRQIDNQGNNLFHFAVLENGRDTMILPFLNRIPENQLNRAVLIDQNGQGWTPFELAVQYGRETLVALFLRRMSLDEMIHVMTRKIDTEGNTLLHLVVKWRVNNIMELIIERMAPRPSSEQQPRPEQRLSPEHLDNLLAQINLAGETLFDLALLNGNQGEAMIGTILNHMTPEQIYKIFTRRNRNEHTLLELAIGYERNTVVASFLGRLGLNQLLDILSMADPTNSRTLFHTAVQAGGIAALSILQFFSQHVQEEEFCQAAFDRQDRAGHTPFELAQQGSDTNEQDRNIREFLSNWLKNRKDNGESAE